jgi:Ca2+-dependent lipid-binding protein
VFSLNGQKVFKSGTKKKTLNPDWQENFVTSIVSHSEFAPNILTNYLNQSSRVGADFTVEVFDWNQVEQSKSLGIGKIELAELEPFQGTETVVNLTSAKHGQKGEVRVRLMFQPEIIAKSRKNTSTFSAAGRAMTQFSGLPVGAGKGVLHEIGGIFGKKEKDFAKQKDDGGLAPAPHIASGQASHPIGQPDALATSAEAGAGGGAVFTLPSANSHGPSGNKTDPGTLRVTVLGAKDLSATDSKPYCSLRIGDKEQKTKHAGKTATPEWCVALFETSIPCLPF